MWEDMKLYWAWRGKEFPDLPPPPTTKRLLYARIGKNHTLCCGVFDDDKYTPLHEEEFAFWKSKGYNILYPKEHHDALTK